MSILDVFQKTSFTFNDLAPFLSPANMDFSSKCIWKDLIRTKCKEKKTNAGINYSGSINFHQAWWACHQCKILFRVPSLCRMAFMLSVLLFNHRNIKCNLQFCWEFSSLHFQLSRFLSNIYIEIISMFAFQLIVVSPHLKYLARLWLGTAMKPHSTWPMTKSSEKVSKGTGLNNLTE